jgi:hypothetical protein
VAGSYALVREFYHTVVRQNYVRLCNQQIYTVLSPSRSAMAPLRVSTHLTLFGNARTFRTRRRAVHRCQTLKGSAGKSFSSRKNGQFSVHSPNLPPNMGSPLFDDSREPSSWITSQCSIRMPSSMRRIARWARCRKRLARERFTLVVRGMAQANLLRYPLFHRNQRTHQV